MYETVTTDLCSKTLQQLCCTYQRHMVAASYTEVYKLLQVSCVVWPFASFREAPAILMRNPNIAW